MGVGRAKQALAVCRANARSIGHQHDGGEGVGGLWVCLVCQQFNKELNARISTVRPKVPVQVTLVPKTDKT